MTLRRYSDLLLVDMVRIDTDTVRLALRRVLLLLAVGFGLFLLSWLPWPLFSDIETVLVVRVVVMLLGIISALGGALLLIVGWALAARRKRT